MKCSIAIFVFRSVDVSAASASWIACMASSGLMLGYSFSTSIVNKLTFSFSRDLESLMLSSLLIRSPVSRMNSSLQNCLLIVVRNEALFLHSVKWSKLGCMDQTAWWDPLVTNFCTRKFVYLE